MFGALTYRMIGTSGKDHTSQIIEVAGDSLYEYHDAASPALSSSSDLQDKPCLTLDGTSDYLVSSAPASDYAFIHDGTDCIIFTVMKSTSTATNQTILSTGVLTSEYG